MYTYTDRIKLWINDIKLRKGNNLNNISSQELEISSTIQDKSENIGEGKNKNTRSLYNNIGPKKYKDWDKKNWDKDGKKRI